MGQLISFAYHRVAVMDTHGNVWTGIINDWSDTTQVWGMKNAEDDPIYFEAEGYYISTWAHSSGLKYWSARVTDSVVVDWDK